MESLPHKLLNRIKQKGKGWVFTPLAFADLGESVNLAVALNRLSTRKAIRRLARGIYDYPRSHEKLGELFPPAEAIANAIAERDGIRLFPSGAYAANLLGLSEQVPAKVVFLTDGKPRKIRIERLIIEFRRGAPRYMALANMEAGLVIQALRHLGKEYVTDTTIKLLRTRLSKQSKKSLLQTINVAPAWIRLHIRAICREGK